MSYAEAWHLVSVLLRDPSSWLLADVAGWRHPVSLEWAALRAIHGALGGEALPAPWDAEPEAPTVSLSPDEYEALMAAHRARG